MSILHILGTAGEGGAETYFVDLVTALARGGVAQAAAIRANPTREAALQQAGVPTALFGFLGPLDVLTKPRVAGFAKRQDASLVLAWMSRAARHTPKGPWARVARLGGYYSLKYYRDFDFLVANTEDIAEWIVAQGWPAGRVRVIPNFAAPATEIPPLDRASLDTPQDAPLLLGMGRLHEHKAHDVSLTALRDIPGAYLWIAGLGPMEAKLKGMAEALGVADRVRFLGWRTDASALYRAADVCVFPSRFEPLGNVVIQAWAHAVPVVAAASQGPKALIRDGEDGRLIAIDDAPALAHSVRELLTSPTKRARLVNGGLARVQGEFSEAAVVAQWRHLFDEFGAA